MAVSKRNVSIFSKIVLIFLLVIIPLYVISLMINNKGRESVRHELSESLQARLQFYMDTFESEMQRMMQLQNEFIVDKDVQRINFTASAMDHYELSQRILQIQSKLRLIKSTSSYIKNVSVYIPEIDRMISSNESINILPRDEYAFIVDKAVYGQPELVMWENRMFIRLPYPNVPNYTREYAYALAIELDVETLRRSLRSLDTSGNVGVLLWQEEQNWHLSNRDGAIPLRTLLEGVGEHEAADMERAAGIRHVQSEGKAYLVAFRSSPVLQSYLFVYMPEEEALGDLQTYERWFWLLSIVSLFIIMIFSAWIYRLIQQPLSQLVSSLRKVEKGLLEKIAPVRRRDEFSYLYDQYNAMITQLKILIHEVYEQKIRSQSSELKQLQSQINPHFLYNTYFILYRLAKMHEIEKVILFCKHLGEYFQYITRGTADAVSLIEEIRHTRTYADIQSIRFEDRIEVQFAELPSRYHALTVPKLLLQPIIENAYKYALEGLEEAGLIRIAYEEREDRLLIRMEDNGSGLSDADLEELQNRVRNSARSVETTGIINVHRRLQLMYGNESGIRLERSGLGGLLVTLTLDIREKKS